MDTKVQNCTSIARRKALCGERFRNRMKEYSVRMRSISKRTRFLNII